WYEFRHIVPFVQWPEWIATTGTFIDAAPHYPATMPLLQVWSCIAFGSWDDSAMNWPWLMILIALVCVIYGALRGAGVATVGALVAAAAGALVALSKFEVIALGYRLQLDFQPAWYSLFATYFLFGNWNLLWYMVIVLFALGWRSLRGPKLVPLTAVVAAAFGFL